MGTRRRTLRARNPTSIPLGDCDQIDPRLVVVVLWLYRDQTPPALDRRPDECDAPRPRLVGRRRLVFRIAQPSTMVRRRNRYRGVLPPEPKRQKRRHRL